MIGFAGLSHLGIVSSTAAAARGLPVVAFHPDAARCEQLSQGRLPIFEPALAELLQASASRLRFTDNPAELRRCPLVYLSLDIPTGDDGKADLEPFEELLFQIVPHLPAGAVLAILSQLPPGATRRWAAVIARERPDLHLHYQVETLIFGRAVERALHPERIIVGCPNPSEDLPPPYADFLRVFDCPVFQMRYESAELAKIAINVHLASSVSVTNTLAELCEAIGAIWSEIAPTLKLDRRIGPHAYLAPGLGLSGGNLERDLAAVRSLAGEHGADASVVDAFLGNSRRRRDWVLRTLHEEALQRHTPGVIALWGLAYKPDTASTRNSPALQLVRDLARVRVQAYDPQAVSDQDVFPNLVRVGSPLLACRGASALAVLTPWPEFAAVDLGEVRRALAGKVIVDPFGVLDAERCTRLGMSYFRLGQPARAREAVA
jgi:UDPglucose 6-dehydrogenase